jgi:hypothetical protein
MPGANSAAIWSPSSNSWATIRSRGNGDTASAIKWSNGLNRFNELNELNRANQALACRTHLCNAFNLFSHSTHLTYFIERCIYPLAKSKS